SQELPFPGKLRRKGEAADREADVRQADAGETEASVADQIKAAYLQLAYLQRILALVQKSRDTLAGVVKSELFRYRTGAGDQADVLKAQLGRTKLVRELTLRREELAQTEAELKRLLGRPQESPDIVAEDLTMTTLRDSSRELLQLVRKQNPAVKVGASTVRKQVADLRSAKLSGKPDFSVGYMFQRTGEDFPAYYMLTFNVIFQRRHRARAEVEQAEELAVSALDRLNAQVQRQQAEVQKEYAAATSTAEEVTEYRAGMIPQAEAEYNAVRAEYESNKKPLDSVLTALNGVLELRQQFAQALFDHELALARLETLTGAKLR
ncbi:MAG: TolC family protein, partial [Bryobacteraceae bacterium]